MMTRGAFAEWQPRYAEVGIATFPVRDKAPAVRNYLKLTPGGSRRLIERFPDTTSFGLALRPSGITVVDVDTRDESILADALARHGDSPFIVRSGSGHFQAWYRRQAEGRYIRPDPGTPIDILGDGFVVAPPSLGEKGPYEIIRGSLDDLRYLPRLQNPPSVRRPKVVAEGLRNNTLFSHCMRQAHYCDDFEALLDAARTANAAYLPALPDAEVVKTARSAWRYQVRGENRFGRGQHVLASYAEIDGLLQEDPDAFALLLVLRRHHATGDNFVIANAMAATMPGSGWARKRFSAARRRLDEAGHIVKLRAASLVGPSEYRFRVGRD